MTTIPKKFYILALLLGLFLSGCFETKRQYTINPDLSGKVELLSISSFDTFMISGDQGKMSEADKAKKAAKKILENTAGIETWKDVTCRVNDEGKIEFRGTAYFKDFNALNLDTSVSSSNKLVLAGGKGKTVLSWVAVKDENEKKPAKKAEQLSGPALEKQIKVEKAKFNESFAMLTAMLSGFKEEEIFTLPGEKQSVKGFKTDGNKVVLAIIGEEVLAAIKKLSEDENFWRKTVAAGKEPIKDDFEDINLKLFGTPLPFEAVFSDGKALFDFEAEVTAAKSAYPGMLEAMGIAPKAKPQPAALPAYAKFKALRVGAVSMVFESDSERDIRPNSQEKGYTVHLIGEWEGPVDKVGDVEVTEAVGDDGTSLISDEEMGFSFQSAQLSNDHTAVVFPVHLKLPDAKVKTIKKLAGTVSFSVSSGVKSHDLGLLKLAAGTKAKEFGVVITKAGKAPGSQKNSILVLKMNIDSESLSSVAFFDESKKKLEPFGTSTSCMNDECEMEYTFEGKLPPKASIIIEASEGMNSGKTSFELTGMPVSGVK